MLSIIAAVKFCAHDLIIVASQLIHDKSPLESEENQLKEI